MEVKKGFKQTEIGVIPEDWGIVSLNSVTTLMTNGFVGVATRYYSKNDNGVLYIQGYNVEENTFNFHGIKYVTEEFHRAHMRSCLRSGDLLTVQTGDIGLTTIVPDSLAGSNCHALIISRFDQKKVEPAFASFYLNSKPGRSRLRLIETGTTMKHLNVGDVLHFQIPLPPTLAEQQAIAGALSDADAWIESLEQLIAKKRQIKQGAMQKLLTGKRRLPGFSGEWEQCRVGDVIEKAFCGPSPTCEERNIHGEEWGVLKTTAMTWEHGWDWTKHKRLPEHYWNQPEIEVHTGDVVVTKAGPRHRVGVAAFVNYVPKRILVSGKMIGLRPNVNRALGFMLAAAISAPASQNFLDQRTTGMAESQVNFENSVLMGTPIWLPSISEQHEIVTTLFDMDTAIESLESELSKARQIKQGMMQELLTGRIRLI
jgi:type I restriction enzyme S subunit